MASGSRNGANSTEMRASDGRGRRYDLEGLRSFVVSPRPRSLGRFWRERRGLASFLCAFVQLVICSSPARADFRVCNRTHALINIAIGTDAGEVFKTEGWWVATPGSCATPIRGPLRSRFVYLYATDIDGVDLLVGTATMCIDRGKFVAYGAENCWRRGLQAVAFAEIDTLDSSDWTTFLTDPRR